MTPAEEQYHAMCTRLWHLVEPDAIGTPCDILLARKAEKFRMEGDALRGENERLRMLLGASLKDSERLDWLEAVKADLAESDGQWYLAGLREGTSPYMPTARAAIDAAIATRQ